MAYETEMIPTDGVVIEDCPFCGCKPKVTKDVRYPRNTDEAVLYFAEKWGLEPNDVPRKVIAYEVSCSNAECIIYHNTSKFYLSMDEAIAVWNTRVNSNVKVGELSMKDNFKSDVVTKKMLVANLTLLAEKSFCRYTADRANMAFYKIRDYIPEKYQIPLFFFWQEVGNPDNDTDSYHKACKNLKEYIVEVVKNIENSMLADIPTKSCRVQSRLEDEQDRRSVRRFYQNGSLYLNL